MSKDVNLRVINELKNIISRQSARIKELETENEARLQDLSAAWDKCEEYRLRVTELENALKPFADMALCFKEYRMAGEYYPLQEAHLKHIPVYSRQLFVEGSNPAESVTMHLFVNHFDKARTALENKQ